MSSQMPTRYLEVVNPRTRFAVWAWSPVIVLRVSLVIVYLFWVYASVIAFVVGIPVFDLTTPHGYTPIWAVFLGGSAVASAIGSLSDAWQRVERWATLVLSATLLGYVGALNLTAWAEGDLTRQFGAVVAIIASVLPVTRFIYLAAQSGKARHVPITADD